MKMDSKELKSFRDVLFFARYNLHVSTCSDVLQKRG